MVLYGVLTEQFIIALFAAAILPGLMAILLYVAAVEVSVRINKSSGPAGPRLSWGERWVMVKASWRVLLVAFSVSGGIYTGIFTVTEAASVGATLALVFGLTAKRISWPIFVECLMEAAGNTCMIFVILIGASIFSYFVALSGVSDALVESIRAADLAPLLVILILMIVYIILGAVFDTVAAMVITLPFVFPLILDLGFDPIWWGVMMVMVMEIGMITPPIGLNVFVLHGASGTPLGQIYKGIVPFLGADMLRLALVAVFPSLALVLPRALGFT